MVSIGEHAPRLPRLISHSAPLCKTIVSYLKLFYQHTHPFLCRYEIYSYSKTSLQYHLFHEAFLITELRVISPSSVHLYYFFCPFAIDPCIFYSIF